MSQSFNYKSALLLAIIPIAMVCDPLAIAKRNLEQSGRYRVKSIRLADGWRRYTSNYGYQLELPPALESSGLLDTKTEVNELYDAKSDTLLTQITIKVDCSFASDKAAKPDYLRRAFEEERGLLHANGCDSMYYDTSKTFYVIHSNCERSAWTNRFAYIKGIIRKNHFYQMTLWYYPERQALIDSISPRIFASFQ